MFVVKAVVWAQAISPGLGAHLRKLNVMPIIVSAPIAGSAIVAAWLEAVSVRMHLELPSGSAGSAAAVVAAHGIRLPISAAAQTIARRVDFKGSFSLADQ